MVPEPVTNVRRAAGLAATGALIAASLPMFFTGLMLHNRWERGWPLTTGDLLELGTATGIMVQSAAFVGFLGYRLERRGWDAWCWCLLFVVANVMPVVGIVIVEWLGSIPITAGPNVELLCCGAICGLVPGMMEGMAMVSISLLTRALMPDPNVPDPPSSCDA